MSATEAAPFRSRLAAFHRRAAVVGFVRQAAQLLVPLALAAGGLAVSGLVPLWSSSLAVLAGAIATAAAIMLLRRPPLAATAMAIDARGGFDNVVSTALQFADADDDVARLIVRDARGRLESMQPAIVFPLRFGVSPRVLAAAVAVGTVAFLGGRGAGVRFASGPAATGATATVAGGDAKTTGDATTPPAGSRGSAPRAQSRASETRDAPVTQATEPPHAAGQRETPAAGRSAAGSSAAAPAGAAAARATDAVPPAAASASPASPMPGSRVRNESAASTASAANAASDGAGGAGSTPAFTSSRAGGARASAAGDGSAARTADVRPPESRDRYRAAAARAEEALEQQRVPADLRDVVRAYFNAIRP